MSKKIYISPSSQWANEYAYGSYTEAEICGKIAESIRLALVRNNYDVRVGSNKSTYQQRVEESNNWGADLHIPIHTNAGGGDGTLVMCYPTSKDNVYVKNVYQELANLTPTKDEGVKTNNGLYEITKTKCVCVYIECEFHDDTELAKWIVNNVTNIGESIAKGICNADNKTFVTSATQEKEIKYTVQCGAFIEYENAKKLVNELQANGFSCFIKEV